MTLTDKRVFPNSRIARKSQKILAIQNLLVVLYFLSMKDAHAYTLWPYNWAIDWQSLRYNPNLALFIFKINLARDSNIFKGISRNELTKVEYRR